MAKIIAITNQKGGVGKSTTSINLSAALSTFDRKILLIDLDPQGNSSRGFGVDTSLLDKCVFDVLVNDADINETIQATMMKNVDLLPSRLVLASIESIASKTNEPHNILKSVISYIKKDYDYIIIDCPPSLGLLTINALTASNTVLIPVQCEYFALTAVSQMLAIISKIQSSYNPSLGIEGFLMTMYDAKTTLATEITTEIRGLFKENTFLTQIPRNISIPESNAKGMPVTLYRPTSSGSLAYISLAKEVLDHE